MAEFQGFGKDAFGFLQGAGVPPGQGVVRREQGALPERRGRSDDRAPRRPDGGLRQKPIPLKADGKRSIFRIHRDVRFAKDKSPYKTHCGAVMTRSGGKMENGLLYLHVGAEGCFAAAGFYRPEAADLARLRKAIAAGGGKKFAAVTAALKKGKLALGNENQLTRLPRGFEALKDGPLDGLIRLKSLIVEEPLPDKLVMSAKLAETVVDFTKRAMPLLNFGWAALG